MEELFSGLFFFILWMCFIGSAVKRAKKKDAGKGGPARSQQPLASRNKPGAEGAAHSFLNRAPKETSPYAGDARSQDASVYRGSLKADSSEGMDPCHDDPSRIPSGSLYAESAEGTDPCHDDPSRMPSGSLYVESAEGTDPCHPDTGRPSVRNKAPSSVQNKAGFLSGFSGNDVVRGFVWGEILNRKRA